MVIDQVCLFCGMTVVIYVVPSIRCWRLEAVEQLSLQVPACESVHEEALQSFTESFGSLLFTYSFYVGNVSQSVEDEQLKIHQCLHRISLVHAQVKIIFEIRTDSATRKQVFSAEAGSKVSVTRHSITTDAAAYGQSPFSAQQFPSCPQTHPVWGDTLSCVIPTHTIESGLCGELSLVTMATLAPCMDQYCNWPTHVSCIQMLVYSPCGMPLMQQEQTGFLQSLASSLSWADLGLSTVHCVEAQSIQGVLCSDVVFSVETSYSQERRCSNSVEQNSESEWSRAVQQTLTIFIFTQYTDPFHSHITGFIRNEEILERHLDEILWYNRDQVRTNLQSTMKNTLKGFRKRCTARQKLDSAIPVVLSSVNSIIASSSSAEFRRACFDSMGVKSTHEVHASLRKSLQCIVDGHFIPKRKCKSKQVVNAEQRSEQNSLDTWDEDLLERSSQRIHCDLESFAFIPKKKQRSEPFSETSDTFMNSVFEQSNTQRRPLSTIQRRRVTADEPPAPSLAKLRNQQVERQWLQEIENFSEWD